ncbi:MAG: porin family protein [Candidatus Eisenbacteria bacterium]
MRSRMAAVALLALLLAVPVMAQTKPIQLGVKAGVNLAELVYDPELEGFELERRMGIAGGALLGFTLSPGMSLDTDFLYIEKGAKWDATFDDETVEYEAVYSYVVINPMLRFAVQSQGLRPYFMAGAEIGFLFDAKYKIDGKEVEEDEEDEDAVTLKDMTKDTDFGVNFGAGVEIPSGSTSIFFEGRYSLGLSDIQETDDEEEEEDDDAPTLKHRGIYLMGGIRF